MAKYGMIIDVDKCSGCYNCFLSCRDEFAGNDYPPYSGAQPTQGQYWMQIHEKERGTYPKVKVSYIPLPCLHCEEASCIAASSGDAVYRRVDGIVLIDPEKASGQKEIIKNCPHRVISWNKEKNIPQKCTFCAHLLDKGWDAPRCVEACPTGALVFGDMEDPESDIYQLMASQTTEELHPEYGLKPRVVYKGLPKRYIAGEILLSDHPGECGKGVQVTLVTGDGETRIKTDNYGDFEFDGLVPNGSYTIRVEHDGYRKREIAVQTRLDINLGEIILEKAE